MARSTLVPRQEVQSAPAHQAACFGNFYLLEAGKVC
jgi:hypothetical protein